MDDCHALYFTFLPECIEFLLVVSVQLVGLVAN